MNVSEASEWVGVSGTTIRKYLKDFEDIKGGFSQSALPERGKHRRLTDRDVAIVAWIANQFQNHRLAVDEVHSALTERIASGEEFELPPRPDDEAALAVIPREQHEAILEANQKALERAVAERDALIEILDKERDALLSVLDRERDHVAKLNREIGRLAQLVRQLGGDPGVD